MDRREQVGVVIRRHLLEHARETLEAHPRCRRWGTAAGRDRRAAGRTP
jgi:hypothetical protein